MLTVTSSQMLKTMQTKTYTLGLEQEFIVHAVMVRKVMFKRIYMMDNKH